MSAAVPASLDAAAAGADVVDIAREVMGAPLLDLRFNVVIDGEAG